MSPVEKKHRHHDRHLALLTLFAGVIPAVATLALLWFMEVSVYLWFIAAILLTITTGIFVASTWQAARFQYRSLYNLLEALVKGDYSIRGSTSESSSPYDDLVATINNLAGTLQRQRLQSEENQLLLVKVISQIDVAIIAWDADNKIRLINPAAGNLFGLPHDAGQAGALPLTGPGDDLVLPASLAFTRNMATGEEQVRQLRTDTRTGRFRFFKERFITEGNTHHLLFISDVSHILRREEMKAWQNLIRVLSHEINNSLAPLGSLSNTLATQIARREQDEVLAREVVDGLDIISKRAESLAAFVSNYRQIANLPAPEKTPVALLPLLENLCALFPAQQIDLHGDAVTASLDRAQFEQLMINLIKNAIEAHDETTGEPARIRIDWETTAATLRLRVTDNGKGLQNPENLFTPFYTTKANGSGIGLVLCRQIIEAHQGHFSLMDRIDGLRGCEVTIELPTAVGAAGQTPNASA